MTIEMLAEMGITESESIAVYMDLLRRSRTRLGNLISLAVDTVVTADQEEAKRGLIKCWRDAYDAAEVAADLLERGPMDAKVFAKEIEKSLLLGMNIVSADMGGRDEMYCRERANNIAQAYSGRVAREPK